MQEIRAYAKQQGCPAQMAEFLIIQSFDLEAAKTACDFYKANGGWRWGASGWDKEVADQSLVVVEAPAVETPAIPDSAEVVAVEPVVDEPEKL